MLPLPPDLKLLIAKIDPETWFHMWKYDKTIQTYTQTEEGRKTFVELFTILRIHSNVQMWTLFYKFHRENDKPAIIWPDGTQQWWVNGKLHRDGGKPAVIWPNKAKQWWVNDNFIKSKGNCPLVVDDGVQ